MKKRYIIYSLIICLLVLFDQLTKFLVIKFINFGNTGISFGILSGHILPIVILTLFVMGYILYELITNKKNSKLFVISSLLIIGGAIGNLIDRVFRGFVIDFISFTLFNHDMAIFNVADIFITFGIIIYIIDLIGDKSERSNSRK